MERRILLLMLSIVLGFGRRAGAVGGADYLPNMGMPEWAATSLSDASATAGYEGTVGQTVGGEIGLADQVRDHQASEALPKAPAALPDPLHQRSSLQEAMGLTPNTLAQTQERVTSQEGVGGAAETPMQVRERLMAMMGR